MNDQGVHLLESAPGAPGIEPRWTSSAKTGVGTSLNRSSRVWFTISHGILNEVYYPRVDFACTRDMGLIVTGPDGFFAEEKRDTISHVSWISDGVPAFELENIHHGERFTIHKRILSDPRREAVLQWNRFTPRSGAGGPYQLYVLLAPHLANQGKHNTAFLGDYKGVPMLFARHDRHDVCLALASSAPWKGRSAGFVGVSDGWRDLSSHGRLTAFYRRAEGGNVALVGEIDLEASSGEFLLCLGLGRTLAEAGNRAHASLLAGFHAAHDEYIQLWRYWQAGNQDLAPPNTRRSRLYRASTAVLRTHDGKQFPGACIASLSIPWGFRKGDDDLGGYHLVWPRDLAETAGGYLAAGAIEEANAIIEYLRSTQEADGHWPQNMWLDGTVYWSGIQLDETAFPILLVYLLKREESLRGGLSAYWPMVKRAAQFVVTNGPVTDEDRWEENAGYTPFTLAVEIAALLVAADFADEMGETDIAAYLRETADWWNDDIERWLYVRGGDLAESAGVHGYYIRIAPPDDGESDVPTHGVVSVRNRAQQCDIAADHLVSTDALALVRFGLRGADDPRIQGTIAVIDRLLKVDTPFGPVWRRYNNDGYGEKEDGSAFDGAGIGRGWPLLVGERAHYELLAGRRDETERLLRALEDFANEGGLFPEQVWDGPAIPERELEIGRPTGSAMPLVWAHAEYIKLLRSLRDGQVFDLPIQTVDRYIINQRTSPHAGWRFRSKRSTLPRGKTLRIETITPAIVRWTLDGWTTTSDTPTRASGMGTHVVELPTSAARVGTAIEFTFQWIEAGHWENRNFKVVVFDPDA